MLSLNASWTVSTLLWNIRIPPRQQRTGELSMVLPRRVNQDDPLEGEDTIVVIFCVGEQCAERMVVAQEWLRSVYIPPGVVGPGEERVEGTVCMGFVPPPNWVVKSLRVRTVLRPEGGMNVLAEEGG
jgi:hypothetical protein